MVLQTPYGRHWGRSEIGGVESLTGLPNQTRERVTAGCLIESAFLQYRRLTRWIVYLLGDPSPNDPRIGSDAFGEAGAFFWPVLDPEKGYVPCGQHDQRQNGHHDRGARDGECLEPRRRRVIGMASTHSRSSRRPPR